MSLYQLRPLIHVYMYMYMYTYMYMIDHNIHIILWCDGPSQALHSVHVFMRPCIVIPDPTCHSQFVDVLMKTYTSEAVFLLTTFINMARARVASSSEEVAFIDTITEEVFQVCT